MTHFWTRASVMVLATAALGACTTPQYPTEAGQPRGAPLSMPTPNFPIVESTPMATTGAGPAAAPTTTAPVQSTALPPPAATAPTPAPVASSTLAPLTPPAPRMIPTTVTETKTVPVADGRVVSVEGKPATYVVKKGDHIDAIARKLGTTRTQLVKDNDLKKPYRIHPGDTLSGPSRKSKAYVVESGDTLYAIARRFSVKAAALADENDTSVNAGLRPGQKLVLPSGYRDIGAGTRTVTTTRTEMKPAPAPTTTAAQTVVQNQTSATTLTAPAQTVAATTTTTVTPAPKPYTPPVTQTQPAPRVIPPATTAAPVAKPYTPAPSPYVPPRPTPVAPAPAGKPYTPSPSPYVPPASASSSAAPMVASSAPPTANEIAAAGAGRFIQPVTGDIISGYGPKDGGQRNDGVNFVAPAGTPVRAAAAGEVVYAGDQVPGFGNLVLVKHDAGWVTAYAHLGRVDVKMRDVVMQGQQIGQVGSTGGVSQPQLHFEVRYAPTPQDKARPVDPTLVLPR